ncbi:MAG: preprotein translocase subunit SecE [Spirochaetes bacterium]|nr:preprotein translocase subunit SecE [Spirochaetota bacterium]
MKRIWQFLVEARAELKKATWPSWDEVSRSTIVVFITVIIFAVMIYLVDGGIDRLFSKIIGG